MHFTFFPDLGHAILYTEEILINHLRIVHAIPTCLTWDLLVPSSQRTPSQLLASRNFATVSLGYLLTFRNVTSPPSRITDTPAINYLFAFPLWYFLAEKDIVS